MESSNDDRREKNSNIRHEEYCYYSSYYYPPTRIVASTRTDNHPPINNDVMYHPYYANYYPTYRGYQANKNKSRHAERNQEIRAEPPNSFDIRGSGAQSHTDSFRFSNHSQWDSYPFPPSHGFIQSSYQSVRETRSPADHNHQRQNLHPQSTLPISHLAPPDLNHDLENARPILYPETENTVVPDRDGCKGRFSPGSSNKTQTFETRSPTSPVHYLRENDIVCGRGAPTLFHKGNKKFRDLILQYQSTYLFSKRPDKPGVAWNVLEIVTSNGGRFVRRVKTSPPRSTNNKRDMEIGTSPSCYRWEQLNERQAYDKICQSLREGAPELRRRILLRTTKAAPIETRYQETNENSKRKNATQDHR